MNTAPINIGLFEYYDGPIYGNQKYITMIAHSMQPAAPEPSRPRFSVFLRTRRDLGTALQKLGADVVYCPGNGPLVGFLSRLSAAIKSKGIDVMLCHNQMSLLFCFLPSAHKRLPIVWHIKDLSKRRLVDIFCGALASRILVISQEVLKNKGRLFQSLYSRKISILPLGVDTSYFSNVAPVASESAQLRVAYIGSIVPRKCLHVVLDAMARLRLKTAISLLIAGGCVEKESDYYAQMRARASKLESVKFIGWTDDIKEVLHASDVVVLPSLAEGTPRSLVEAMAAGRPVIATSAGGIQELVKHGVNGFLINFGDDKALAGYLELLSGDPALLEKLGRAAREHALRHHDFNKHITALVRHCSEVRA